MAAAAPALLSTATIGILDRAAEQTETTGTVLDSVEIARTAISCGAITTIPSTPWSRSRSAASWTERASSERRVATLTKYPASRAACSMLSSVRAGP